MTKKLIVALAALALAAFALAACGGDDDGDDDAADTGAATTTETATEAEGGGGGGGAGGTIQVEADPNGGLAYTTGTLSAAAGEVTIEFDNPSSTPHDVQIEGPDGEDIGGTDVITGDTTSATVDLADAGEYVYYCSVDGHRAAGMEETLEVE